MSFGLCEERPCGSVVEHTLGKGEVAGSILAMGSNFWRKPLKTGLEMNPDGNFSCLRGIFLRTF
jgi:hypothetical protein